MKTIKTTWGKVFENDGLVLFNNYPDIVTKTGDYEELYQWVTSDDDEDNYDTEVFQWYIIPRDYTVEWLERFCPEIVRRDCIECCASVINESIKIINCT